MDAAQLVDRLRRQGVAITVSDGHLILEPRSLVPAHLVNQLRETRSDICHYLQANTPTFIGYQSKSEECWPLELWRRMSRPEWRENLRQSLDSGDKEMEEYSRWMLLDILLDPEYPN